MVHVLAQLETFETPAVDFHAFAPEIILLLTVVVVLLADLIFEERGTWATSSIAGLGLLAALWSAWHLRDGGGWTALLGGYGSVAQSSYEVGDAARFIA